MVKHNNVIPNIHGHKKWYTSSRGPLKVKLSLNQATRKKSRRMKRAAKAAQIAPRPLQLLRPSVFCQTQRYNSKLRLGRGFTLEEIREAGLTPEYARTIGIAVDHRRSNRCMESLNRNVDRLKEYQSKLVLFPKRRLEEPEEGDSPMEETSNPPPQMLGKIMPLVKPKKEIVMEKITNEMKEFKAFTAMRIAKKETRVEGYREAVRIRKSKE